MGYNIRFIDMCLSGSSFLTFMKIGTCFLPVMEEVIHENQPVLLDPSSPGLYPKVFFKTDFWRGWGLFSYSPGCDPAICSTPFFQNPEHHLMNTTAKVVPDICIPDLFFLVCMKSSRPSPLIGSLIACVRKRLSKHCLCTFIVYFQNILGWIKFPMKCRANEHDFFLSCRKKPSSTFPWLIVHEDLSYIGNLVLLLHSLCLALCFALLPFSF